MTFRQFSSKIGYLAVGASFILSVSLIWIYASRPDWATAITILPAWVWLGFGIFILFRIRTLLGMLGLAGWLVFTVIHVEEPRSLLRGIFSDDDVTNGIRIVTINCSGSLDAVRDTLSEHPDIVLIQESPAPSQWTDFLKNFSDYQILPGIDASILVKGRTHILNQENFYTLGEAYVRNVRVGIVSLRLKTSSPRIDLWRAECWRSQAKMRKANSGKLS